MSGDPTIGIVGGVGPYAGLDLTRKVFDQTLAGSDQEHLPVILVSRPGQIADRTEYLLGRVDTNPAFAIARIIGTLERAGATVIGIPCNTAHAPAIFDRIISELERAGSAVRVLHMIREVAIFLRETHPGIRRVGVLSTMGTYKTAIYTDALAAEDFDVVLPPEDRQRWVNEVIYNPDFGIKAQSNPVSEEARRRLLQATAELTDAGAQAVVLGCTEMPLAVSEHSVGGTVIIDPTLVLARALIRETAPQKLKPLQ